MLHWVDSINLVAATSMGLLKSRDGGYHWRLVNPRTDLIRLHFIDPINGFAIAGSIPGGWIDPDFPLANAVAGAELLRTWDGGVSFHHRATALPLVQWVQFVTPLHGWAAGPDGIETTLDGGSSWQVQLRFPSTLFRYDGRVWWGAQVGFRDELHGFAFYRADQTVMSAGSGRLYYTADGGFHWQLQSYTSPGEAPDAVGAPMTLPWSVNGELVVTGPGSAMILETNFTTYQTDRCFSGDAGRTWNCSALAFTGAATGGLAVHDGKEWLALTDDEGVAEIAMSHDGGNTWHVDRFLVPGWGNLPSDAPGAVGTWTNLAFLNDYHRGAWIAPLLQDGRVLVCGGRWDRGTTCELYDPREDVWTEAAPMLEPDFGPALVLKSGDVLVLGAKYGQRYNRSTDRWVRADGAVVRDAPCVVLLADGRLLVVGGRSPNSPTALTDADFYDPALDRWSSAGSMSVPRVGCQAVLLPDGRVLVTGGDDPPTAKLFDPRSNIWKPTGPLHVNPHYPPVALVVLSTGKVMAASSLPAGGIDPNPALGPQPLPGPRAELFDPLSSLWTPLAGAPDGLSGNTITLDDGKVLFVGGPLYDPTASTWSPVAYPSPMIAGAVKLLDGRVLTVSGIRAFAYTAP